MSTPRRITPLFLAALKPGKDNGELVIDPGTRGHGALVMRVTDTGKPIYYRYFNQGRRRFELVGHFDPKGARSWHTSGRCNKGNPLTLAAAREGFHELARLAKSVGDLKTHFQEERATEDAKRRQAEVEARAGSFGDLLRVYVTALRAGAKPSADEVEKVLRRNVDMAFPRLLSIRANEITPEDIQAVLARMINRGCTRQTNIVRSYLRAAFAHVGQRHDFDPRRLANEGKIFRLPGNPVDLVPRIQEYERMGERVLSSEELRTYFAALSGIVNPIVRSALSLHFLTGGQRLRQLLRATWADCDLQAGVLTLLDRKGRAKPREHLVPLLPEAVAVFEELATITGAFTLVFTTNGEVPLRLETLCHAIRPLTRQLDESFSLRDVRRSVETRLAEVGVIKEIRAQLLSHGRGDRIAQTYDKYSYLPKKRKALEVWRGIVFGTTADNVVCLPSRTSR
jgi:integrase